MEVQNSINSSFDYKTIVSNNNVTRVDFDPDNDLELFCYNECSNSDSTILKRCRGLVFHSGKLILSGFPYTDEFVSTQTDELKKVFTNISEWQFFQAYEGTLIRVFNFNNKWFISTNKKLNAFRSKWSCRKSFGELFVDGLIHQNKLNGKKEENPENILNTFLNSLNKEYQYMFLIKNNNENRIVCKPPLETDNHILHVGTFMNNELNLDYVLDGFARSSRLYFENMNELVEYVSNCDYTLIQGIIAFNKNNEQVKVYNPEYQSLYKVRGNIPSVKFRYLSVRMDRDMVNKMYLLYPEYSEIFESYEKSLYEIATTIHNMYFQKHIKKIHTVVPKEQYIVMKNCHAFYLSNPKKNIVTLKVVINFLNETEPHILNKMIKGLTNSNDKNKKEFQHPRSVSNSLNSSPAIIPIASVVNHMSPLIKPLNIN